MIIVLHRLYIVTLIFLILHQSCLAEKAVCIVPVADLIGHSAQQTRPDLEPEYYYSTFPLSASKIDASSAPRFHQLLFGEVVDIVEDHGDEYLISIPQVWYEREHESYKQHDYYILRKNVLTFKELAHYDIDQRYFPAPISFSQQLHNTSSIVTLIKPFFDPVTQKTYSAGTRFLKAGASKAHHHTVYIFDATNNVMHLTYIPDTASYINNGACTKQQCINTYLTILKSWVHQGQGYIPYVFGGCSYITRYNDAHFKVVSTLNNTLYMPLHNGTCTGIDCSGLIVRAAQIAGIPFYFKNSITIAKNLQPITQASHIADGDIIWIPGHVMVISSVKDGLLIEARSYDHGYGKVQEIHVSEQFQDINSYNDLCLAYNNKQSLKRLNKRGEVVQTIAQFKLLKLASIWNS